MDLGLVRSFLGYFNPLRVDFAHITGLAFASFVLCLNDFKPSAFLGLEFMAPHLRTEAVAYLNPNFRGFGPTRFECFDQANWTGLFVNFTWLGVGRSFLSHFIPLIDLGWGPNCLGYFNPLWDGFTSASLGPRCLSYFEPLWVDFASACPVTLERNFLSYWSRFCGSRCCPLLLKPRWLVPARLQLSRLLFLLQRLAKL